MSSPLVKSKSPQVGPPASLGAKCHFTDSKNLKRKDKSDGLKKLWWHLKPDRLTTKTRVILLHRLVCLSGVWTDVMTGWNVEKSEEETETEISQTSQVDPLSVWWLFMSASIHEPHETPSFTRSLAHSASVWLVLNSPGGWQFDFLSVS